MSYNESEQMDKWEHVAVITTSKLWVVLAQAGVTPGRVGLDRQEFPLVTPQVGPRARRVTVVTEAPLETGRPMDERCGTCSACA